MKNIFLSLMASMLVFTATDAWAERDCTLLMNASTGKMRVKIGDCDNRYSPASTFKVALALMGFDAGILQDAHNPAWPFKEGYTVNKDNDKQTTDPTSWEANSVVWYSQKLTTEMGMEKFQEYVNEFNYGNKDLNGDAGKDNGLTRAWLFSSLKISAVEQAQFIKNIFDKKFNIDGKAYENTLAIIPKFPAERGWTMYGKTGSGELIEDGKKHPQGWFVGWAEKQGEPKLIFVKLVILDVASEKPASWIARDEMIADLPKFMQKMTD